MGLRSRLGLRTQLLALFALLALAFLGPLYVTGSSAARALVHDARDHGAHAVARAVAAHLDEVARNPTSAGHLADAEAHALSLHEGPGGVLAARISDHSGRLLVAYFAGELPRSIPAELTGPRAQRADRIYPAVLGGRRVILAELSLDAIDVVLAVDARADERRADSVARLVALLAGLFAAVVALFAWVVLGRLFVRPLDALAANAAKVAAGAKTFPIGPTGTAETETLASSLRTMSVTLLTKQEALEEKVHELGETTLRLSAASSALVSSEHYAGVGKLAAGMAHEIGNPIAALLGLQEIVLSGDLTPEEQHDFVSRMHKETTRIHGVLRDLLDYARAGAPVSEMTDSVTSCNLSQVVTDLRKLLEPQRSFKEIDLQIDVPDSLRIPMAPQRLLQVLLNLTMNAADALSDTPSPRTIRLEAALENGQTNVWVIDNGPGVPDALRARIFDPFVTTKEVGAGTGLGLPVCLGLVESAGGTLELSRRKAEPNTSGATAKGGAPNTSGATAKGGAPNTSGAEFVLRFPTVRASRFE